MGGPNWYRGVVSGGYPICGFRQFLARMCRFATIQNVTDRQTTTTDDIGYQRRPYGRPKTDSEKYLLLYHPMILTWCYLFNIKIVLEVQKKKRIKKLELRIQKSERGVHFISGVRRHFQKCSNLSIFSSPKRVGGASCLPLNTPRINVTASFQPAVHEANSLSVFRRRLETS